jgi:Fe-S oxidoreductase
MTMVFAPGCALLLHTPGLVPRVREALEAELGPLAQHEVCCRHEPGLPEGTTLVNVCPGCDRRFRGLAPGIGTLSLWEVLAASPTFPFPDHGGRTMTILDACPARDQPRLHEAVRTLLGRMNIRVVEPERTRTGSVCCGDSFFGSLPTPQVEALMAKRAGEMPEAEVVVYCVSCVKSMHIGGRTPRHLVDLLFGEPTLPGTLDPDAWHGELDAYIAACAPCAP